MGEFLGDFERSDMNKKKKSFIQRIRDRINGEHSSCPAYWWEQGIEDCSEGCHINHKFECWKCVYRFFPVIIVSIVIKYARWKEERHWKKELKRMDKTGEFN